MICRISHMLMPDPARTSPATAIGIQKSPGGRRAAGGDMVGQVVAPMSGIDLSFVLGQRYKAERMAKVKDMLLKAAAVLHRRGVSVDEGEDLVHDAFVRLSEYEKVQNVRSQEAVLVRTAINISIDHARRRARAPVATASSGLEQFGDAQPDPFEIARARARLQRVNQGLQELSETSRRILLARRLDGTSVADIAFREGMSVAAVEKQIARATFFLMKWVEEW